MVVYAAAGAVSSGTAVVTTTIDVETLDGQSGTPFVPVATLFFWSGRTESADAVGGQNHRRGVGFGVSATDRRCMFTQSVDAAAAAASDMAQRDDACIGVLDSAGAVAGLLDYSVQGNGFRLTVDDQFPDDVRIGYLALGGDSLTLAKTGRITQPTSAGSQVTSGLGIAPSAAFFLGYGSSGTPPHATTDSRLGFGFAHSSTGQAAYTGGSNDAAATMVARSYCLDGVECLAIAGTSVGVSQVARAALTSFDATGFTLNWIEADATARSVFYLLIQGGSWKQFALTTLTDTTTDIATTGHGFAPAGALLLSAARAESTQDTASDHDAWSMGACASVSQRVAMATLDQTALADSAVSNAVEHDEVYVNLSATDTIQGLMDIKSFDADGLTFIMDDADPAGCFIAGLAVGPRAAGGVPVPRLRALLGVGV